MESPPPLPNQHHTHQYKLNYSKLLEKAQNSNKPFLSEFFINLCLTSSLIDTPNKIFAIYLLIKSINTHNYPFIPQVYYIVHKTLKYLTTQNGVDPTLFMYNFLFGSNQLDGIDMPFTLYLRKLIHAISTKNKIKIDDSINKKISDTEEFMNININQLKLHFSSPDIKSHIAKVNEMISHIMNIDSTEEATEHNNEEFYYMISASILKQLHSFIKDYLSYDRDTQMKEFESFMDKAFDKDYMKYVYYNKRYSYELFTKTSDIEVNCVPFAVDNSDLIVYKDSLSIRTEATKENVYLRSDMEMRKDYYLLNNEQFDLIDSLFKVKKVIERQRKEIYYKDIKCFIVNRQFNNDESYTRFYKRFHIQISHYKTLLQFKEKITTCIHETLFHNSKQNAMETNYSFNFYTLPKNNSDILNQITLFTIKLEGIFYTNALHQLHYDDDILMRDVLVDNEHILLIDMFPSSAQPNIEVISSSQCTSCKSEVKSPPFKCELCCYGMFCSEKCALLSHEKESVVHAEFHREIKNYYVKEFSIDDIASISMSSLEKTFHGIHGLINLKNTCFINSSIQCLFHTEDLTKYFYMKYFARELNHSNKLESQGEFSKEYNRFISLMFKTQDNEPINPNRIVTCIYDKMKVFKYGEQNDAHEFICMFFDKLHEDLNRISNKKYIEIEEQKESESDNEAATRFWNYYKQREDSIIIDLFYGQYKSSITCPECNKQSITYEPFCSIGLPIPIKVSILTVKVVYNDNASIQNIALPIYSNTTVKTLKDHIRSKLSLEKGSLVAVILNKKKIVCQIAIDSLQIYPYVKNEFEIYIYDTSNLPRDTNKINIFIYIAIKSNNNNSDNTKCTFKYKSIPLIFNIDIMASITPFTSVINEQLKVKFPSIHIEHLYLYSNNKYYIDTSNEKIKKDTENDNFFSKINPHGIINKSYCQLDPPINDSKLKQRFLQKHPTVIFASILPNDSMLSERIFTTVSDSADFFQKNPSKLTLTNILDLFHSEEKLTQSNSWFCSKCKKHQEAYKKLDIYKTSKYLILQLKRFRIKNHGFFVLIFGPSDKKISTHIEYPTSKMDLTHYVIGPDNKKCIYDLYGIVKHNGRSLSSGHYTATCRTEKGWMHFNDKNCSEATKLVDKDAYLLFYRMRELYPNQPGYLIYHNPTVVHYPKKSHVYQEKELFKEIKPPRDFKLPNQTKPEDPVMKAGASYSQTIFQNPYGSNIQEQYNPDFVKLDKMVLRFYGYFKESVEENELENARIRLLVIFYYLQDDTISINDTKQENSGIPQGAFLNRGKVRKDNGDYFSYRDLTVGKDVTFYGKIIRLYDCDIYTRQFYAENGITQPPREEHPMDPFLLKLTTKPVLQKDHLMKDYLEYSMGGGKVKPAKQFLENDRKVLRFNATFEGLKYIIHYYLSDDTVEIREVNYTNSGRDPFPLLLKRNRLPRKFCVPQPGEVGQFDFYSDADIEPFMTLWAFNRPFKILGCDEFTADYYLKNYRRNFPVGGFEDPPQKSKSGIVIPPYNGYGSEEDSLGNCLRLLNKPPKKDYYKYIDNDRTILRFLAKLNTKVMEDVDRRFLISFFLCDDSIQVYEMANRNSGIWEGKFLERGQYKNVENENKKFTISDFEIGKSMRINTFSFHVLDADEFTKKWIAQNFS